MKIAQNANSNVRQVCTYKIFFHWVILDKKKLLEKMIYVVKIREQSI